MNRQNIKKSKQLKKLIQSYFDCPQNNLILSFDYNEFSLDTAKMLGQMLQNCLKNLQLLELSLKSCFLGYINFSKITSGLSMCTNLKYMKIDLYNNQIQADGLHYLGLAISNFKLIETIKIDLRRNNIGPDGLNKLVSSFLNCQNLSTLILGLKSNNISGKSFTKSCTALIQSPSLKTLALDLSKNNINANLALCISSELAKTQTIQILKINFSKNIIGDLGVFGLSQNLFKSTCIQSLVLRLSYNKITEEGLQCLIKPLIQCQVIKSFALDIEGNEVSERNFSDFISCIGNTKIENFQFNNCEEYQNLDKSSLGFDNLQFANLISLDLCSFSQYGFSLQQQIILSLTVNFQRLSILRLGLQRWDQQTKLEIFNSLAKSKTLKTFIICVFNYYSYYQLTQVKSQIQKRIRKIKSLVDEQIVFKNLTNEIFDF
ncbi:hypothetical protein ABPG73_006278 [Tetrahymena malaccensis]